MAEVLFVIVADHLLIVFIASPQPVARLLSEDVPVQHRSSGRASALPLVNHLR